MRWTPEDSPLAPACSSLYFNDASYLALVALVDVVETQGRRSFCRRLEGEEDTPCGPKIIPFS